MEIPREKQKAALANSATSVSFHKTSFIKNNNFSFLQNDAGLWLRYLNKQEFCCTNIVLANNWWFCQRHF